VTASTAFQLAAGVVISTATGIAVNLATADHASAWMWFAVVAVTLAGIALAIWSARGDGRPPGTADTRSAPGAPPGSGPTVNVFAGSIRDSTIGGTIRHGSPGGGPTAVTALVLVALVTGLAFGLAYRADRDQARPAGVLPSSTVAAPTVEPMPGVVTTPAREPQTPEAPRPTSVPIVPSHEESPSGTWLSLDNTFETLHLDPDGTYRRENPPGDDETGRYRVQASRLTFTPAGAASQTFTWSLRDELLTLTDGSGSRRVYTRN
jgi:hypothetical protein